jgi:hypothetical protein
MANNILFDELMEKRKRFISKPQKKTLGAIMAPLEIALK